MAARPIEAGRGGHRKFCCSQLEIRVPVTNRVSATFRLAARLYLESGREDEAESMLRELVEKLPRSDRALWELARLYARQGREDEETDLPSSNSRRYRSRRVWRAEHSYRVRRAPRSPLP